VNTLARVLDSSAKPFSSTHPDAIAAWGRGEFERAVTFDPDFGAAWSSWIEQLARSGKTDEALVTADKALMRASLRSPLNRAQVQLQAANLRKDEPARIAALTALAGLTPTDVAASLALAEVEQRQRNYTESAALYRRVLTIDPANAPALNGLGYAEGEAGRVDAAVQALQRYGQLPGQGTNALDSIGEVYFMNGRFAEAEKYFSQVTAHDPAFAEGAALMKAAYAHWLAGDKPGADAIARRYLDARTAQTDPDVIWREAVWLFATGREKEAVAKLGSAPAVQKPRVDRQLSVWRGEVKPPTDVTQLKALYTGTNPAADGLVRMIYANALLAAGNTAEARALLQRWPLPESAGDPLLQSLVFPEFLDLRRKLGMQ
jgi:tetratricopeptide (TPR) repeat protein